MLDVNNGCCSVALAGKIAKASSSLAEKFTHLSPLRSLTILYVRFNLAILLFSDRLRLALLSY